MTNQCTHGKECSRKIFLIVHKTFENTNEFYFCHIKAKLRLHELAEEYEEGDVSAFKIIPLKEGEAFDAEFCELRAIHSFEFNPF